MLEVRSLAKAYAKDPVLTNLSISFAPGKSHVLLGESGSGKTTLIKIIAGMLDRYEGEVRLGGKTLQKHVRRRAFSDCASIQYIFQDPYSSLDPRLSPQKIFAKTEQICRRHNHDHWPGEKALSFVDRALLAHQERPVGTLSGGQRQKICIARALIPKPRVLLADEACSMLDSKNSLEIYDLFNRLKEKFQMTLLIVKHDIDFDYTKWDVVSLLEGGSIVETIAFKHFFKEAKSAYAKNLIRAYRYFGKDKNV